MKSAQYYGAGDLRIETVPDPPPPGSNEVTVAVSWAGICGTDLHEWTSGPHTVPTPSNPHPLTHSHLPVAFGHEFTGRITALPPAYSSSGPLKLGIPVMVDPRIICRSCSACNNGFDNICPRWGYIGLSGGGGGGAGFSEFVNVEMRMCHPLPDDGSVDLDSVVLCQPLTVGRHALASSGVEDLTGKKVLVLGGGPVGLAVLLNLRAKGVGVGLSGRVFLSEPTATRAGMVEKLGLADAGDILDPGQVDVARCVRGKTGDVGVDIVFDTAGSAPGMLAGMEALRLRGTYVNIAGWRAPFEVPMKFAMFREITIKFSLGNNDTDYREVVEDFVAGKFQSAEALITRRLAVEDLAKKGLDELVRNKDAHVKIVATWDKGLLEKFKV